MAPFSTLKAKEMTKNNKGSAYVELAVILPVLFILVFGILEVGLITAADNSLVSVVDYGIRAMAVNGGADEDIMAKIEDQMIVRGLDPNKAKITASRFPVQLYDDIYLAIEYPYSLKIFGLEEILTYQVKLKADSYAISEKYFR